MHKNKPHKDRRNFRKFEQDIPEPGQPRPEIKPLTFFQQQARWVMTISLALSDLVSILLSFGIAVLIRNVYIGQIDVSLTWNFIFLFGLFFIVYSFNGLYPGVGLSPVDELKKLVGATSSAFLILLAITFFEKNLEDLSRLVLGIAWLVSLILVQVNRWFTRILGRKAGFWGEPVVVVGNGPLGNRIVTFLKNNSRLGLKPYIHLGGCSELDMMMLESINCTGVLTVILVIPEMSEEIIHNFINDQRYVYHRREGESNVYRIILISSLSWIGSLGIIVHDFDGEMGLEVRQNLLLKWNQVIKRILDLTISVVFGLIALPFLLIFMAMIALDSPGGIFFKQKRIGHSGKEFEIFKFRTMYADSDDILKNYLAENPDKELEWNEKQKLENDPRVTRVGKFLRKLSLDEIPQFINVLIGEMSVVGPRPFYKQQQEMYGSSANLYYRVRPGISGLWQVMGRNQLSFQERVRLDEYYIRNWSVWMDIYILLRTFWVIIKHEGAF